MRKRWCHDHKPGHQTTGNARVVWSDESPFTLFTTSGRVYAWRTPKKAYNLECLVPTVKKEGEGFCDDLGSNIVVQYSVGPIITLHGRITAREYVDKLGNQMHPMIQTLFPNNRVFQDDNAPIHTAGTLQSWFENREDELLHLPWSSHSANLNIIEPLWSVLDTRMRNRFPPPKSLK
jgi:hypothetical protein